MKNGATLAGDSERTGLTGLRADFLSLGFVIKVKVENLVQSLERRDTRLRFGEKFIRPSRDSIVLMDALNLDSVLVHVSCEHILWLHHLFVGEAKEFSIQPMFIFQFGLGLLNCGKVVLGGVLDVRHEEKVMVLRLNRDWECPIVG